MTKDTEVMRAALNGETARIAWSELQTLFARGLVVQVDASLDLLDVAVKMALDDKIAIASWMENKQVGKVSDDTAQAWFERNPELWSVVIAPWVLVQEKTY